MCVCMCACVHACACVCVYLFVCMLACVCMQCRSCCLASCDLNCLQSLLGLFSTCGVSKDRVSLYLNNAHRSELYFCVRGSHLTNSSLLLLFIYVYIIYTHTKAVNSTVTNKFLLKKYVEANAQEMPKLSYQLFMFCLQWDKREIWTEFWFFFYCNTSVCNCYAFCTFLDF